MKNMDLNPGGIIGALICVAAVAGFIISGDPSGPRRFGKFLIMAGFAGGFAGNFAWNQVFGAKVSSDLEETDSNSD